MPPKDTDLGNSSDAKCKKDVGSDGDASVQDNVSKVEQTSSGLPNSQEQGERELSVDVKTMTITPVPSETKTSKESESVSDPDSEDDSELEEEADLDKKQPWNAVCVMGVKVYSQDPEVNICLTEKIGK